MQQNTQKQKDSQNTKDKSPNCTIMDDSIWLSIHAGFFFLRKHLGIVLFACKTDSIESGQPENTFQKFKTCILLTLQEPILILLYTELC